MVPRCYLRQNPPFTENHDLSSFPRPTLPCNLPPRCPFLLPRLFHVSPCCASPFAPPRPFLCLLQQPSPLGRGGVTIEKQLAKHAGNWSPVQAQMFFIKTFWNDCYLGKSTSSYVWAAEMQNKPLFNKCLRHCILQRSHGSLCLRI